MINISLDFLFAGKAIFTASSPKGTHYTYKVVKKEYNGKEIVFVNLLTGADNLSSYSYMGVLDRQNGFRLTAKSRLKDESTPIQVFRWAVDILKGKRGIKEGYEIRHENRCGSCGRVITNPKSLDNGLGPVCGKKHK